MMRPIEEILAEAEKANSDSHQRWESVQSQGHEFLVADTCKGLREQWYLGHFALLYNKNADVQLRFAEHLPERNKPQPDFACFDNNRDLRCHIEITEWLEPYRRRDREYGGAFKETAHVLGTPANQRPCPIERLRQQLCKKFREKAPSYPPNTWLLIDDNVGLGDYKWADRPLGDVEVAQSVVDEIINGAANISAVWLLRETTRPMTIHRLFPVES